MEKNIQQLVEMGATRAQAKAALKRHKDVMEAAEQIFDGRFDDIVDEDEDTENVLNNIPGKSPKDLSTKVLGAVLRADRLMKDVSDGVKPHRTATTKKRKRWLMMTTKPVRRLPNLYGCFSPHKLEEDFVDYDSDVEVVQPEITDIDPYAGM